MTISLSEALQTTKLKLFATGRFRCVTLALLLLAPMFQPALAQEPNDLISKGNKQYDEKNFGEAEMNYRNGMEAGADPFVAGFNLGDALFRQERYDEAATTFRSLPNLTDDKAQKAAAYHNLGNAFLKSKKYEESVNSFKKSLINNPHDLDTKYNLAYAQRMLQKKKQQQKDKDKNKKKDQDKKKDKNKQNDKNKDKQDQKQDQQKQDKSKDDQKQQQQQQSKISKDDAERMLDAVNQDEKKIRDRLQKQQRQQGSKVKIEKDW